MSQADEIRNEPWLERVLAIEEGERQSRSLKRRFSNARGLYRTWGALSQTRPLALTAIAEFLNIPRGIGHSTKCRRHRLLHYGDFTPRFDTVPDSLLSGQNAK
jgi:hypothetical protein